MSLFPHSMNDLTKWVHKDSLHDHATILRVEVVGDAGPGPDAAAAAATAVPHLAAGALAIVLFLAGLAALSAYADQTIAHEIRSVATITYSQKALGLALQQEALRHVDLLLLYGSSEVAHPVISRFDGRRLFAQEPTGFALFTVGGPGIPLLKIMENIGALGSSLKGRKVAISLAPETFAMPGGALETPYAGTFSPLQALSLVLSPDLSDGLKREIARHMAAHARALGRDTVVRASVRMVADDSAFRRPLYFAFLPLARLHQALLEMQDRVIVLVGIRRRSPAHDTSQPEALPFDWPALERDATDVFRQHAGHNNPYGFSDDWWRNERRTIRSRRHSMNTGKFRRMLSRSDTWLDLEQLLKVLNELGAEPLILSMPFNAGFLEYQGVTPAATQPYYARVRDLAARYGARTSIFDDHETDHDFFWDGWLHISPKAWVHYDQALDAFYHDTLR